MGGVQISSASPAPSRRDPGCLHLQQPCVQSQCHPSPAQHQALRAHVASPAGCQLLCLCMVQPPRTQAVPGSRVHAWLQYKNASAGHPCPWQWRSRKDGADGVPLSMMCWLGAMWHIPDVPFGWRSFFGHCSWLARRITFFFAVSPWLFSPSQ